MDNTPKRAKAIIARHQEEYGHTFELQSDGYERFLALCSLADRLYDNYLKETGQAAEQQDIVITADPNLVCGIAVHVDELVFENGRSNEFFTFVKAADRLSFSQARRDKIVVDMVVSGLWEMV